MRQYIDDVDKAVELFNAGLLWRDYNGNHKNPSKRDVYPLTSAPAWGVSDVRGVYRCGDGGFFVLLEE